MRLATLIARNLVWHRRTNFAVTAGVCIATAVLAGALLVGDSVRASLRRLALERLGRAEAVIQSSRLFREQLAGEFSGAVPLLSIEGIAVHQASGRRASRVQIYGVDERFWRFHGLPDQPLAGRALVTSELLRQELGAATGDSILLRVEKPSEIPKESLHGRKEDAVRTLRFQFTGAIPAARLGEFSLVPRQGPALAAFVPLERLQQELEQPGKANLILLATSEGVEARLRQRFSLDDLGLKLKRVAAGTQLQVESPSGLLSEVAANAVQEAARASGLKASPLFTYLANSIRRGDREIPYSLVTAIEIPELKSDDAIVLNDWAARDLGARPGDAMQLDYFVWKQEGRLETESAQFRVSGITPVNGPPGDRDFAPEYPGITDTEALREWDPPFPMDLNRIRKADEEYWHRYKTTPKAFVGLGRGRKLWGSRFGSLSAIRLAPAAAGFEQELRRRIDPLQLGFAVVPVRERNLAASAGSTDFGEYFTYFSFFLVVAALLLAALVFRLGIEQRVREIGVLKGMGFSHSDLRRIFLAEGAVLAAMGTLGGAVAATGYAALIMTGLRTWWVGAVGTTLLELHVGAGALAAGCAGGFLAAMVSIVAALRELRQLTPRGLMGGPETMPGIRTARKVRITAVLCAAAGVGLLAAGSWADLPQAGVFFGAAALLLIAALCAARILLGRSGRRPIGQRGTAGLMLLGFRGAGTRPGRSLLTMSLIAFATFLIVSLDSFRRAPGDVELDPRSGNGGYAMVAESLAPIYHDLGVAAGRDAYGLDAPDWRGLRFLSFRVRPGDDASCLNLYRPQNPRVLATPAGFLREGRFSFSASLAGDAEARANPWLLLERPLPDGAIPAVADANSMAYILHKKLGDEVTTGGARLRLVAALRDSIFQSELIVSERMFLQAFPEQQGYRFFLLAGPRAQAEKFAAAAEEALSDFGFDATGTVERLAQYHRIENTYISTFQSLGVLGLLLGTAGMAVILLRNVLERRRELALLEAVGFRAAHLKWIILSENLLLLAGGTAIGTVCALLAVAPALAARGTPGGPGSPLVLPLLVMAAGTVASVAATRAALRAPLLESLRAE